MLRLKTTLILLMASLPMWAQQNDSTTTEEFDWTPVMDAIIWHESKGQPNARNGIYLGVLQIAPVLVRECNNILAARGSKQRFTNEDRRSPEKSKEMFRVIMSKYNRENDIDKACRIWKGGIRYNVKKTQPYVNWVRAYMRKHADDYKQPDSSDSSDSKQ